MKEKRKLNLALIGDPVEKSRSPELFAQKFAQEGIDGTYSLIPIKSEELHQIRSIVNERNLDAFNVTMPHKRAIIDFLDAVDETSRRIFSVNLVTVERSICGELRLVGHSTDGAGFVAGAKNDGITLRGKNVLIFGAGGAAYAIADAIRFEGAIVMVANRTESNVRVLAERLGVGTVSDIVDALPSTDIFINATPCGMYGKPEFAAINLLHLLKVNAVVCDIVYEPPTTALLAKAAILGHKTQNGFPMLKAQADIAFSIILGTDSLHS